jgi:AcrR family transcriptional regulator
MGCALTVGKGCAELTHLQLHATTKLRIFSFLTKSAVSNPMALQSTINITLTTDEKLGKRDQTKLANRAAILEAGRAVFAELGYEGTTVRDIIRRTQLASGTFYNYFKSKDDVFHALHDDGVARFKPMLTAARIAAGDDFERYMMTAFGAYFQFLLRDNLIDREVAKRSDWTRVRFDTPETLAMFDELKADIIAYAKVSKLFAIDPELLTASIFGIAQEIGDRILRGKVSDLDVAAKFAAHFVLGGAARIQQETTS